MAVGQEGLKSEGDTDKIERTMNWMAARLRNLERRFEKMAHPKIKDIAERAMPISVDYTTLCSAQCAEDVKEHRKHYSGKHIKVISKIENVDGMKDFDKILAESDGILVACGGLSMEGPIQKAIMAQKMICIMPEDPSEFLEERRLNDLVKHVNRPHVGKPKKKEVTDSEKGDRDTGNENEYEKEEDGSGVEREEEGTDYPVKTSKEKEVTNSEEDDISDSDNGDCEGIEEESASEEGEEEEEETEAEGDEEDNASESETLDSTGEEEEEEETGSDEEEDSEMTEIFRMGEKLSQLMMNNEAG